MYPLLLNHVTIWTFIALEVMKNLTVQSLKNSSKKSILQIYLDVFWTSYVRSVYVLCLRGMWLVSFWVVCTVCTDCASFCKVQSFNFQYFIKKLSFIETDFYGCGVIQEFRFYFESFPHSTYLCKMELKWKFQLQNPHNLISLSYINKMV